MKRLLLLIILIANALIIGAQNEDHTGAISLTPIAMRDFTSLAASGCESTVRNLGSTTSPQPVQGAWTMANDVWFQFTAVAEVAKIKVCSPTTFDAAIEVWNNAATTALASANVAGSGGKEYLCVTGLTSGTIYKVRVGRVSGTGAGTFNISYEHLGVEVRPGYFPDPPGAATCYDFTTTIQRSLITYPVGATRWTFIDESGTVFGPFTLTYAITLQQCPGICEGHTYQVYCEVQATDAECGTLWWGKSTPRSIVTCSTTCPTITISSGGTCGSTYCDIFEVDFQASYLGSGFEYQFRFVTDNGNTDFCSAWSTTPIFEASSFAANANPFRYSKIYEVYVRARKCASEPAWCGPCVVSTCSMPYVSVTPSMCCKWRNKSSGGQITCEAIPGMDNYRFRFTPISINPCLPNPFTPQGPAINSPTSGGWGGSSTNPASLPLTLGTVYSVQVQARKNSTVITQCDGTTKTIPGQQSDWGPPCLIGFRSSSSPAVGTPLGCYCTPSAFVMEDEMFMDELLRDEIIYFEEPTPPQLVTTVYEGGFVINTVAAGLAGDGVLTLYNLSGQAVLTQKLNGMEYSDYLEIAVNKEFPTGVYVVSVIGENTMISDKVYIDQE
ncbi:MAG: T9SS type A sorting domain-containing protein [Flavobacteriales bacterium]|nr:T9SS type A sorting domain-containing protein [Flavobacteriales bacterium]